MSEIKIKKYVFDQKNPKLIINVNDCKGIPFEIIVKFDDTIRIYNLDPTAYKVRID